MDFSFIEDVMDCDPILPSCKPKAEACDTLNQWEFKDSQDSWPKGFYVNMSSIQSSLPCIDIVKNSSKAMTMEPPKIARKPLT